MDTASINFIEVLKDAEGYVILGSASAMAHGYETINSDLDVVVRGGSALQSQEGLDVGYAVAVEGLSVDDIFEDSIVVNGYRFMGLSTLTKFYRYLAANSGKKKHQEIYAWLQEKA